MDLDEDKILNDAREAAIQAKMMADLQSMQPQTAQPGTPPGGPPNPEDPTGTGGGNIAPGNAPEPGAPGNTGAGGGDNMEGAPPPPLPQG